MWEIWVVPVISDIVIFTKNWNPGLITDVHCDFRKCDLFL